MSHTPGPWSVDADDNGLFIRMEATGGKDEYLAIYASANSEQREADAFLIAAAPDLLEALEYLLKINLHGPGIERARAAIAKARGEA